MTEEALIHFGLFHARDAHRNHFEMHHVVARRSLVALRTGLRNGRRMTKLRDGPFRGAVALRAVVAE